MKCLEVNLLPGESKRLIARALKTYLEFELQERIVAIARGSTCAYFLEEILGREIEKWRYLAGLIVPDGLGALRPEHRMEEAVVRRGSVEFRPILEAIKEMDREDVVVKGPNIIGEDGYAGILLGARDGGTIGNIIGHVRARGIRLVLPASIIKYAPVSIMELAEKASKSCESFGMSCGIMPVSGEIITEIEALEILFDCYAYPLALGGLSGAEGSVTLLIEAESGEIKRIEEFLREIKSTERGKEIRVNRDLIRLE